MRSRYFLLVSVGLLLLLVACSKPTEVSSSVETSVSSVSSATEEAESEKTVFELFEDFPAYDPGADMSYEAYFSEERYLEQTAQPASESVPTGYPSDMPGYQYVKGVDADQVDWETKDYYWESAYDNLYLMNLDTGERTLLTELADITRLFVFPDRLYLVTENAVWRCGRLGEDLTCVYEHPTNFYVSRLCESELLFFETLDDVNTKEIWRLYLPSGTADKLCKVEELDSFAFDANPTYMPVSNEAFLYAKVEKSSVSYCVYSVRTGQCTPLANSDDAQAALDLRDWYGWVRKYYELNRS